MAKSERRCPKCEAAMQEGFIPVCIGPPPAVASVWVVGPPEKGRLGGVKFDRRNQCQIRSYRCSGCGYLESYATQL
jgi:rubredoxin